MNKDSQSNNKSKKGKFFEKKKNEDNLKRNKNFEIYDFAKLEQAIDKISDFIIIFFYIYSYKEFLMFVISTKENNAKLNKIFYITTTFFFINIIVLFAF